MGAFVCLQNIAIRDAYNGCTEIQDCPSPFLIRLGKYIFTNDLVLSYWEPFKGYWKP
jgi:hypothetical protein